MTEKVPDTKGSGQRTQSERRSLQFSSDQKELLRNEAYMPPCVIQLYFIDKSACRVSRSPSLFSIGYRLVFGMDPGQQMKH